jgi:hypothetical protein
MFFSERRRIAMSIVTGVLAVFAGCKDVIRALKPEQVKNASMEHRAEPPPPYIPPYSEETAVENVMKSAVGKVLRERNVQVVRASLRGFKESEYGGKQVFLDVVLQLPLSPLGVRYHVDSGFTLEPETGKVMDEHKELSMVVSLLDSVSKAIERAERLPEVIAFVKKFQPLYSVGADYTCATSEKLYYGPETGNETIEILMVELLENGGYRTLQYNSKGEVLHETSQPPNSSPQ